MDRIYRFGTPLMTPQRDYVYIASTMPQTTIHEIQITPAYDHHGKRLAGRFNARLGKDVLVRGAITPFYSAAQALLAGGIAEPNDVLLMRYSGSQHVILRSTVGKAAKLAEAQPQARAGASNAAGSYPGSGRNPAHG
jgi:hypothetical protein